MLAGDAGLGFGRASHATQQGFRAGVWPARLTRGCGTGGRVLFGDFGTLRGYR